MRRGRASLFRPSFAIAFTLFAALGTLKAGNLRISSIQLTVSNASQARAFYSEVLQFKFVEEKREPRQILDTMRLGEETVLLVAPTNPGRPVPQGMQSNDRWFEHLAIVVSDMDAAYQRLMAHGVSIVSTAPQTLPRWNFDAGDIRAVYFRDPDGHFLELIQFPSNKGEPKWHRRDGALFMGIDHTAFVVRDMKSSLHFYRDSLGFTLEGESYNYGIEQERLSRIPGARVKIDSFRGVKGPGIELLQYEQPGTADASGRDPFPGDLLYWQINIEKAGQATTLRRDPDGHSLGLNDRPANAPRGEYMREAFYQHWPRYLMEGAELGIFMIVALYATIVLEYPKSVLHRKIKSPLWRRFLMGSAIGLTVVALIYCSWGRQSGAQFNPAVTLARLSLHRIEPWDAVYYIIAQFIGGWLLLYLAGLPLRRVADHKKVNWVVTKPGKKGVLAAFIAEFIISFLIIFSLLMVVHFPALEWGVGLLAGLYLCLFITFESPFSGMSLNPARSVASALPARSWKSMWLYFVSPPLAMLLAAYFCRLLADI